jgi:hypothetical protein
MQMKQLRTIVPVALAAALATLAMASSASATTLEVGGVNQSGAVTIEASSSASVTRDTFGLSMNKCASTLEATTSVFTGTTVRGPINTLTFKPCEREELVVHTKGSLSIERIGSTTNSTVRSIGAVWTQPSPFGTLTCTTAASPGTDIGTLTGVGAGGTATIDIKANLSCGISAIWEGTYTMSGANKALGIVA